MCPSFGIDFGFWVAKARQNTFLFSFHLNLEILHKIHCWILFPFNLISFSFTQVLFKRFLINCICFYSKLLSLLSDDMLAAIPCRVTVVVLSCAVMLMYLRKLRKQLTSPTPKQMISVDFPGQIRYLPYIYYAYAQEGKSSFSSSSTCTFSFSFVYVLREQRQPKPSINSCTDNVLRRFL